MSIAVARDAAAAAGVDRLTTWLRRPGRPSFYLGTHMPRHLETSPVPLFVSRRTLEKYRTRNPDRMPKALIPYAIDSGGFTELQKHGRWSIDEDTYGGMVYRFMEEVGRPTFVAPMDWMCEEVVIRGGSFKGVTFAGTGLTVAIHQELTVENLLYLREQFPHAPWIPVLQGQTLDDYLAHVAMYADAGIDLAGEQLVGLGSVCRREATGEIELIASTLARMGLRLHGFGVKAAGLRRYAHYLDSADSLAWSFGARVEDARLPSCTHRGPCNNCLTYAVSWRERVLAAADEPAQDTLALAF